MVLRVAPLLLTPDDEEDLLTVSPRKLAKLLQELEDLRKENAELRKEVARLHPEIEKAREKNARLSEKRCPERRGIRTKQSGR
jgi:predicted  nucleic acid-binding Zn-ribbon protein